MLDWGKEAKRYSGMVSPSIACNCSSGLYFHAYHVSACARRCDSRCADCGAVLLDCRNSETPEAKEKHVVYNIIFCDTMGEVVSCEIKGVQYKQNETDKRVHKK